MQRRGSDDVDHIAPLARGGCELRLTHEMAPQWAEFALRSTAAWTEMTDAMAEDLDRLG